MADSLLGKPNITDEQLVLLAQGGDDEAMKVLISGYSSVAKAKAVRLSCKSVLPEDLAQEGMFGLLSAIYSFDRSSGTSFKTYADKCILNSMLTAIRSYSRKKHLPLNSFISLDSYELEIAQAKSPEDIIIESDEISRMMEIIEQRLSPLERSVVSLYLGGKSYEDIAAGLNISLKSVDNAMQRAYKKFKAEA